MKSEEMKDTPGEIYTEGNSELLTQYFKRIMQIEGELRVAFFGDQYITDVYACASNPGWDGFAIVEELAQYDTSLHYGIDPKLIKNDKYWGEKTYFVENEDGERLRSYFISKLEGTSRYMLPFIKNID